VGAVDRQRAVGVHDLLVVDHDEHVTDVADHAGSGVVDRRGIGDVLEDGRVAVGVGCQRHLGLGEGGEAGHAVLGRGALHVH
jgi:hypothetical protein